MPKFLIYNQERVTLYQSTHIIDIHASICYLFLLIYPPGTINVLSAFQDDLAKVNSWRCQPVGGTGREIYGSPGREAKKKTQLW